MIWKPHAGPQEFALAQPDTISELLYGGARGGGKTEAGIIWITELKDHPRYNGLVLRKSSKDLSQWIRRVKWLFSGQDLKVVGNPAVLKFASGAEIHTGHLKDIRSLDQYQGGEYHRILIEELTQIPTIDIYLMLLSANRSTVPDIIARLMATANPGGRGHAWVKARFIDIGPPNKPHIDDEGNVRMFIPSTIDDNPTLKANDPKYINRIEALKKVDPALYEAWRFGTWNSFVGQMFKSWDQSVHVVDHLPSKLNNAIKIATFDWGFTNPACMLWIAITFDDENMPEFWVYRELYTTQKTPEWWGATVATWRKYEKLSFLVLPHDCFSNKGSEKTIARVIQDYNPDLIIKNGQTLALNARINRAAALQGAMAVENGKTRLKVLSSCANLIRTIPGLVRDDDNPEVVDKSGEDHAYDALSMGVAFIKRENKTNAGAISSQNEREIIAVTENGYQTANFWDNMVNYNQTKGSPE